MTSERPVEGSGYPWNGDLKGGDRALMEMLDHYRGPEHIGLNITLPVENWDRYAYFHAESYTRDAGDGDTFTALTIPLDVRAMLIAYRVFRASGDGTLSDLEIRYPLAYSSSAISSILVSATTVTSLFWPDPSGVQSSLGYMKGPTPLLLEPGTLLDVDPAGDGVAETVFASRIDLIYCKIVRAQAPRA